MYGISQKILGKDKPEEYFFSSKAAQEDYFSSHDYCDKFTRQVDVAKLKEQNIPIFDTIGQCNNYIRFLSEGL